jgi:hypothetical protein
MKRRLFLLLASLSLLALAPVSAVARIAPAGVVAAEPSSPQTSREQTLDHNAIAKIWVGGGMCLGECFSEIVIAANGHYQYRNSSGKKISGILPRQDVRNLRRLIRRTNFAQIKSRPSQNCPLAYDGPESRYSFRTSNGVEVVSNCQHGLDPQHPLFKLSDRIFQQVQARAFAPYYSVKFELTGCFSPLPPLGEGPGVRATHQFWLDRPLDRHREGERTYAATLLMVVTVGYAALTHPTFRGFA